MNCPKDKQVDHKFGDTLDDRKSQLRICTNQQNNYNKSKILKKCSSIFKGVVWNKLLNSWRADIKINKFHSKFLGSFKSESEAAIAYNNAAEKYHGEFARLNIIKT